MSKYTRKQVKALIELSSSVEEADKIIQQFIEPESIKEKIAFLKGMFDPVTIIDLQPTDSDELIYTLMLDAIISAKHL